MWQGKYYSISYWLKNYKLSWLRYDIVAGLAVFILAVPSGIAHGSLAGLNPVSGLYAAVAVMLVFMLFTTSKTLIVGTEAPTALLVAQAVAAVYSGGDPGRYAALAAMLAMLTGVFVLLTGVFKAGSLAGFITRPVMVGYMNGIALLIMSSQLTKLVDIKFASADFFPMIGEFVNRLNEINYSSLVFGLILLFILLVMKKVYRKFPTVLVITILSIAAYSIVGLEQYGINILGKIDGGLPLPAFPSVTWNDVYMLIPAAFGLAVIIFPDIILTSEYFALKNRYKVSSDRELIALGVSNIASGLYHGFTVGSNQPRTIVNDDAAAKTPFSGLVAALLIIIFLLFFTPLLEELPLVTLAAIIIASSIGFIDIASIRKFWKFRRLGVLLSLVTTIAVLLFGVIEGIFIAVLISAVYVMAVVAKPNDVILRADTLKEIPEEDLANPPNGIVIYRFLGPVFSPNINYFKEKMLDLAMQPGVKIVVLDTLVILNIDFAAADTLKEIYTEYQKRGIQLVICNASKMLMTLFERAGIVELMGMENFYKELEAAIENSIQYPSSLKTV
jgi:SulP family sulfate permease